MRFSLLFFFLFHWRSKCALATKGFAIKFIHVYYWICNVLFSFCCCCCFNAYTLNLFDEVIGILFDFIFIKKIKNNFLSSCCFIWNGKFCARWLLLSIRRYYIFYHNIYIFIDLFFNAQTPFNMENNYRAALYRKLQAHKAWVNVPFS